MFLYPTTEEEVFNILVNLQIHKGAGADEIRPRDLKTHSQLLTPVITNFINSSLSNATIPNLLKTSIIRPIYKSGSKNDCNNYRPIAILPVIEKVLEEVVVRRLNEFLKKFKIINPNQYGFQKGKNINKLLGEFSNRINTYLGENMHCLAIFIDFSKAFDTLSHENLLNTLERNGIRGNCLEWFRNYLEYRTYRVKIYGTLSNEAKSNNGVPQGSKIGPILYLIYANELLNVLKDCFTFAYADDTAVVVPHNNIDSACEIMQNQMNQISKWCHDNGLVINASKTKIMHIKPPHLTNANINIIFHNYQCLHNNNNSRCSCTTTIELVKSYKYLGVYVDDNFKWLTHIKHLSKKLRKSAYSLYHLSNCSNFEVLKQAYFSLAESYIRHGITAWGNSTYSKSLQQTQNQILKILLKNKYHNQQQLHMALIYANTHNSGNYANNTNINTVNNNSTNSRNNVINTNRRNNSSDNMLNTINNNTSNNVNIVNFNNLTINTNNTHTVNNNIFNTNNTHNLIDNTDDNFNNSTQNSTLTNNINGDTSTTYNITRSNNTNNINSNNSQSNTFYNNTTNQYRRNQSNRIPLVNNLASSLQILNIKSLYHTTVINEFYNDPRYLKPIDHTYNTRQRAEGRFKVERHKNNYGKNALNITLPNIFNKLPLCLLNISNTYKRKYLIKEHFIEKQ